MLHEHGTQQSPPFAFAPISHDLASVLALLSLLSLLSLCGSEPSCQALGGRRHGCLLITQLGVGDVPGLVGGRAGPLAALLGHVTMAQCKEGEGVAWPAAYTYQKSSSRSLYIIT